MYSGPGDHKIVSECFEQKLGRLFRFAVDFVPI